MSDLGCLWMATSKFGCFSSTLWWIQGVQKITLCYVVFLFFTSIINPSCYFACWIEVWGDIEACAECGIHKGMHEHLIVDRCSVPVVAKCPLLMGEVQQPWWI